MLHLGSLDNHLDYSLVFHHTRDHWLLHAKQPFLFYLCKPWVHQNLHHIVQIHWHELHKHNQCSLANLNYLFKQSKIGHFPCSDFGIVDANSIKYGLWSFQTGYTKLERFLHENQHTYPKEIIEFLRIGLMGSLSSLQKSEALKLIILIFHLKNLKN